MKWPAKMRGEETLPAPQPPQTMSEVNGEERGGGIEKSGEGGALAHGVCVAVVHPLISLPIETFQNAYLKHKRRKACSRALPIVVMSEAFEFPYALSTT